MKTSIIAANALLVVGMAAFQAAGHGRPSGAPVPPAAPASARPAECRDAVWPYVPPECGAPGAGRPVRVLRADLGR